MSYYAFDAGGFLGDVASIGGWNDFAAWASARGGTLAAFARGGHTHDLSALVAQIGRTRATGDVESTRANIESLAQKASEVLIVNEGDNT